MIALLWDAEYMNDAQSMLIDMNLFMLLADLVDDIVSRGVRVMAQRSRATLPKLIRHVRQPVP